MQLDRVTITGADDSIRPEELLPLTERFPFVEWGILVSGGRVGTARFPSASWVAGLQELTMHHPMRLSLHLCGRWVRQLLLGTMEFFPSLTDGFDRVQLNFHAENTACNPAGLHAALCGLHPRQFIFQIDSSGGNRHLEDLYSMNGDEFVDAVPLFDLSGGAGRLPERWPEPQYMANDVDYVYHGYAGGLGPDNLEAQLPLIAEVAGPARIWIDMETRVRSDGGSRFDLDKVARALEICEPWIAK